VEKLASVLWKPEGRSDAEFAAALLATAPELAKRGAARLRINVVDAAVAAGTRVRVGRMDPPKQAVVLCWLDEADERGPIEEALGLVASRVESYLVVESEPLRNSSHVAPLGERTEGFNLVTCIEPKEGMAYADFVRHWHTEHRRCALATQSTFAYVRNEIVRGFGEQAPPWAAIVEESFPVEALSDPRVWYRWEGSEEQFRRNRQWMIESCVAFLALDRVESHPMSEYVFER
jgi:hypothetical protein